MAGLWTRGASPNRAPEALDLAQLKITQPTVIYLSGFLTRDHTLGHIEQALQTTEDLTKAGVSPCIYAWSHTRITDVFNVLAYGLRPHNATSTAAKKFAQTVIMPLVSENGKPLPEDEAKRRLRSLTLFGYSAGTVLAQEAFNAAIVMMGRIGYKTQDARRLLQEIVLVATGTMSRPTREKDRFTTIYLAATNDVFIRWKNRLWRPFREFFKKYARPLMIRRLSETSLLITASVTRRIWNWGKSQSDSVPVFSKLPWWKRVINSHEIPHYVTTEDGHSPFSRIALHALFNAITRQNKLRPEQLLEPACPHPEVDKPYRTRIRAAWGI